MQLAGTVPTTGTVVSVSIDSSASHFGHRDELVYLQPTWFATNAPPPLPAVMMMIGGQINTPPTGCAPATRSQPWPPSLPRTPARPR